MPDRPVFTIRPPLRCFGLGRKRHEPFCGRPATWQRPPLHGEEPQYFCEECHRFGDVPIPMEPVFRRVVVSVEVYVAGASLTPRAAEAEAVDLVQRTLTQAGGLVNLAAVSSTVGQHKPQPPARQAPRFGRRGE